MPPLPGREIGALEPLAQEFAIRGAAEMTDAGRMTFT
jgi:hypothetical protein